MRCWQALILFCVSAGCSGPAPQQKPEASKAERTPPADESRRFPQTGLVKMDLISDHLLGKDFMPGGNVATYHSRKTEYQQFLGRCSDAQNAAFLLLDWKKNLTGAKYLAHMGGFFGTDNGRPVYVFTKGAWVAGVAGLREDKADIVARELAARL